MAVKMVCKVCQKEKWVQNSRGVCPECVYKKNHNGKTQGQVLTEKKKTYIRKPTGEKQLFLEIWGERDHVCHNCKSTLPEPPQTFYFMHVKSKGAFPELRLQKSNIKLSCWDCHYAYDHVGKDAYNKRKTI